ncbi:MAG: heavy-metal-associated domain-containing protein [Hyphomicrobiales bacterium]|nr:heavy-metal-associated domain-containing protein [Hyphomicrobiales bacterium]MBV9519352.1 heavy-metal-associated domain-containing protein [Hyphomicrobiales bacterium]
MGELAGTNSAGASVALAITGMSCGGCVGAVKQMLSKVPGVSGVEIDLDARHALVAGTAAAQELIEALQGTGYRARLA